MQLSKEELLKLEEKLMTIPKEKWKFNTDYEYQIDINNYCISIEKDCVDTSIIYSMHIDDYSIFDADKLSKKLFDSIENYKDELEIKYENKIKQGLIKFLQE